MDVPPDCPARREPQPSGPPSDGADRPAAEVLLLLEKRHGWRELARRLATAGYGVDFVASTDAAVTRFYERGGHAALVLGPALADADALDVCRRLRALDERLAVFAPPGLVERVPDLPRVHVLPDLHPLSRAGIGALLRALVSHVATQPPTA